MKSVVKLLNRIVTAAEKEMADNGITAQRKIYYAITDRLTQFACVFSALIHDVVSFAATNGLIVFH
jgi:hypothetical protein